MQAGIITPEPSASHGGFIPSIEGMRAVAVLAVLLFHLDVPGFSGGFLGVDLFFVISGFIITRNILWDLQSGNFSLKEFYRRRIRRLLPALLVTVLLTLIVSVFVVPPFVLVDIAKSAIFSTLSLANVYFWSGSGYFDAAAITKPLLHTWSLSLEEQFYLLWPALLLLLASKRWRLIICLSLLLLSLSFALLWRDEFPDAIFFLLPFRLHQLMAGALIAILSLRLQASFGNICTLLAAAGFLAITVMLDSRYSPAVGAVAVTALGFILLVGRDAVLANVLFGNRPMQWIGKRSYALYLVHWPIIVLVNFGADGELSGMNRVFLLLLSFIFAMGLHEWVERPFRKKGEDTTTLQRMAFAVIVGAFSVTVSVAAVIWSSDGFPSRTDPQVLRVLESVKSENDLRRHAIRFGVCHLYDEHQLSDYDLATCVSLEAGSKNILVIGDSMAADTYMMLSQAYPEYTFSQATADACTGILDRFDIGGRYSTCRSFNQYRFSELVRLDMDLIVLASIWEEDRIQPLKETVAYLHSLGKKVLIIGPRVHFRDAVPLLISRGTSLDNVNFSVRNRVVDRSFVLRQMRQAIPEVDIVDMGSIQCAPSCDVIDGDRLLYYDKRHFTQLGAQRFGERFKKAFDLPTYMSEPDP